MFPNSLNSWLIGGRPGSAAPTRLFTFSYAGGGASTFRQWNKLLPLQIDSYAVQLPGREGRFNETRITQFPDAILAIADALLPHLDRPFAFFGHSLGGLLAFETARHLRRLNAPLPVHLFLSGCSAPQTQYKKEAYSKLSDAAFIQSVKKYGGLPNEILQNSELVDLFLPILRADFSLFETYRYSEEAALDCPITAFGGLHDTETSEDHLNAWDVHTIQAFRLRMFPGNHFYLNASQNDLLTEITRDLQRLF